MRVTALAVTIGLDVAPVVIVDYEVVGAVIAVIIIVVVVAAGEDPVEGGRASAPAGRGVSTVLDDDRGGSVVAERCGAGGELEEPGLVLRHWRGEGIELALVGGEGYSVFTRVPGEGHDVLVVILCDDGLRFRLPHDELAVGASAGEEGAVG